jgi:D-glycero-alpha-D-manno-heptose 1-phosphate guanylyltransferase
VTSAIILAGGLGTRLRDAVPDLPKPMAPVAGRPFLAHQMDHWIGQGIDHFVLSVGYRAVAISNHFGDRYRGVPIDYVVEAAPLGTGGALLLAAAKLRSAEPALLLNGDTYFDVALAALAARATSLGADWCLALFRHDDAARYMGVALSAEGRITALRVPTSPLANGGVYWFKPEALPAARLAADQAASLEDDLLPRFLAAGQRLGGLVATGDFIDIGVPHDYQRAAAVLPRASFSEPSHAVAR